jgi:hypothetical protein
MAESQSANNTTLELVERLNEDVTYDDTMYELYAIQKIERGVRDAQGRTDGIA